MLTLSPLVPAKAGTQWRQRKTLDSRLRGNERRREPYQAGNALAPLPQRREVGQLLLDATDVGPGIALLRTHALAEIEQRVLVRRLDAAELLPGHRSRHRRTLTCARR